MSVLEEKESSLLLDKKLLCFMEQLELLEAKRASLNSLVEQGWFSISKTRYSMGNKQVSALQYAIEIEPLVCVHARTQENGKVDFCTERLKQECNEDSDKGIEEIGPREEGVRRRNKKKQNEKGISEFGSNKKSPELNSVRKGDQNPQRDPLKWFGILVPQSLKQAQMLFKQVIELSAEIAELQNAVLNVSQELKYSMDNKLRNSIVLEQEETEEEHQATESL